MSYVLVNVLGIVSLTNELNVHTFYLRLWQHSIPADCCFGHSPLLELSLPEGHWLSSRHIPPAREQGSSASGVVADVDVEVCGDVDVGDDVDVDVDSSAGSSEKKEKHFINKYYICRSVSPGMTNFIA